MIKFIQSKIEGDIKTLNDMRNGRLNNLDKLALIAIVVISALLYIPFLGNFFMIDPWENHYSHVAWETLEKGSFAKLWYQNSNRFWSKPPLLFWMLMPFCKIHISEFMGRLPIVLFSIGTLAGFYALLTRLISRRASVLATFILMLSPHYFMLSRQIMVDLPFIGLNTLALLCMAVYFVGDIPENEKVWKIPKRDFFLYLFYFFEGWAFLAKGLLSVVIPGTALFVFMLFTKNFGYAFKWEHLKKHLIGFGVYTAVIAPWMGYMWISEGFEFIKIFIWFHHFKRVAGELHKPNDLYTLYVRILGYSMFPWSAFIPAGIYHFMSKSKEVISNNKKLFLMSMAVGPFFFLSFSGTKFYHYIAPVVPVIAIFLGVYLNKLWDARWAISSKIEAIIAVMLVAAIGRDIGNNHGLWLHIVTFYNERTLAKIPSWLFVIIPVFSLFAIILFTMIFSAFMRKYGFYFLFALTALFMTYYFIFCLPSISRAYSLKPHVEAYLKDSPERAPIADYYKWLRKSVSFNLRNDVTFLQTDKEKNVLRFFDKPGTQYVILRPHDKKRFEVLMKRINKNTALVFKDQRNQLFRVTGKGKKRDLSKAELYTVERVPGDIIKSNVIFDDVIKLEGYKVTSKGLTYRDGKTWSKESRTIAVDLYFRALKSNIAKDYDVFLHNEGNKKDKRTKGDESMALGTYPTTFWKEGDIVRHPLKIRIPANSKNDYYIPYIGIYQEEYRGNISNKDEVPNDGDNRYELLRIYLDK
ncbi:MAG: ArnT family glycosyltransferase [bacterium]